MVIRYPFTDVGKALKSTISTEGIVGLWRGLGSSLFRDVPFSGIYWMIYESLKAHYDVKVPTFWFSFLGGAVSGSVSLKCLRTLFGYKNEIISITICRSLLL